MNGEGERKAGDRVRRVYEDERLAGAYQPGNEMPEGSLRARVELIAGFAAPVTAPVVLEIGAGMGMCCAGLARWGGAPLVVGVDPSAPWPVEERYDVAALRSR